MALASFAVKPFEHLVLLTHLRNCTGHHLDPQPTIWIPKQASGYGSKHGALFDQPVPYAKILFMDFMRVQHYHT